MFKDLLSDQNDNSPIIGIDLGTTNSLVAVQDGDATRVLAPEDGRALVPSVVAMKEGELLVGDPARDWLHTRPCAGVRSVKRLMGLGGADAAKIAEEFTCKIETDDPAIARVHLGGQGVMTPPEVSAEILKALKARAETALGSEVKRAVITVPAYFNDAQRQATKDAGRLAGLEVERIINEPTAASLAYGLHRKQQGTVAVYDLGGGTFDISVLRLRDGVFEVLATGGDTHLGGDDVDRLLAERFLSAIEDEYGFDPHEDEVLRDSARQVARAAKERLSSEGDTRVTIDIPKQAEPFRMSLTRGQLVEMITPWIERTLKITRQVLKDSGIAACDIDEVILVGGSTRIPAVQRKVGELFGKTARAGLNPDEVVAMGAAIQGSILRGDRTDMLLLDVTPLSLGIETMGGAFDVIIPRNSTIPTSASQSFTTFVDGQVNVDIHVLQGERELVEHNRSLARFKLAGLPPLPAGIPKIKVTFTIDANGMLQVKAQEERTGVEAEIEVKPSYGLTDEQIEEMIQSSFEHAEEDLQRRMLLNRKTEGRAILHAIDKSLAKSGHLIEREEKQRIREVASKLKEAIETDDLETVRAAVEEADKATHHLAELQVNAAIGDMARGRTMDELETEVKP